MKSLTLFSVVFTFIIGILGGIVGFWGLTHTEWGKNAVQITETSFSARPEGESVKRLSGDQVRIDNAVEALNQALVEVSEKVKLSVVTVFTERVMTVQQNPMMNPFFEDFFQQFFDQGRRGQPRQAPPREFRQQGLGSGVIVTSDGYILTNNHVVAEADTISVRTLDDKKFDAKVIGKDPKTDIAVIKIEGKNFPALPQGDSDKLRVGEMVVAVGSPMSANLNHTVTQGIVSAKGRSNVGLADYEDFIQTDAAINPGNSGGALVTIRGELVGINSAIVSRSGGFQGIGLAVPINMARAIMDSLVKSGKVIRGFLGVTIQDLNEDLAKAMEIKGTEGALVADVAKDGPAEKGGLKSGDIVIEMNGKKIANTIQFRNQIAATSPGSTIDLKVNRDGKTQSLKVKLEEMPGPTQEVQEMTPEKQEKMLDRLGFNVAAISEELIEQYRLIYKDKGVVVTQINPSAGAAASGLHEGDIIISVNRKNIATTQDFLTLTKDLKKGDMILMQVVRGQGQIFLAFRL